MLKAVVHINFADPDRQRHGLNNIINILEEVKDGVEVIVVCHGAGINLVIHDESTLTEEVARLVQDGIQFEACENTLQGKALSKSNLLPDVTTVPSGAVEIILKQKMGYAYFRP